MHTSIMAPDTAAPSNSPALQAPINRSSAPWHISYSYTEEVRNDLHSSYAPNIFSRKPQSILIVNKLRTPQVVRAIDALLEYATLPCP